MKKKVSIIKFISILMTTLFMKYCSSLGDNFVRNMHNTRLDGQYTYAVLERWTIAYCLMECSSNKHECASINYNHKEEICELNRFVELATNGKQEKKLKSQPGWTFYQKDSNVKMKRYEVYLPGEIQPQKNRLITILAVQQLTWEISLDITMLAYYSRWGSVFHLTTGGDDAQRGYRTPAIFTLNNLLYIVFNSDVVQSVIKRNVPLNQKISVKMEQILIAGKPTVRIFMDQQLLHEQSHNWKTLFTNIKFYLSDPWYEPAPVKIFNLKYRGS